MRLLRNDRDFAEFAKMGRKNGPPRVAPEEFTLKSILEPFPACVHTFIPFEALDVYGNEPVFVRDR